MRCPAPLLLPFRVAVVCTLAMWLAASAANAQDAPPPHDRVVVVIMENRSFAQVSALPFASSLMASGATFTDARGVLRPSQPNYFALWAGNSFGVSTNNCPVEGGPFPYPNLGQACEAAGLTWKAYSENLPSPGSADCSADGTPVSGLYTRKHAPWTYFTNVDHSNERPYSELAGVLAAHALPNLTFIIPNNCHNTHNDLTPGCQLPDGDLWLSQNLPPIIAELGPNGLLILTYDEDDTSSSQHILTVVVGPKVIPGSTHTATARHYAVTRMICEVLGLPILGFGIFEDPILDIWDGITPAHKVTWGKLKTIYR